MKLEELAVYRITMDIGERVWAEVAQWGFLRKILSGSSL